MGKKQKRNAEEISTDNQVETEEVAQPIIISEASLDVQLRTPALKYLLEYKYAPKCWKFRKILQKWIFHNAFDTKLVNDKYFDIILEYFAACEGRIKTDLITKCENAVNAFIQDPSEENTSSRDRAVALQRILLI